MALRDRCRIEGILRSRKEEETYQVNIRYRKLDDETRAEGHSFYPLLRVLIRHGANMRPVLGLVDSGASDCIFSASLGKVLGIDVVSGKPYKFHGFDLQETPGFVHTINLQVDGFSHWIEIDAVFIESEVKYERERYPQKQARTRSTPRTWLKDKPCLEGRHLEKRRLRISFCFGVFDGFDGRFATSDDKLNTILFRDRNPLVFMIADNVSKCCFFVHLL